MSIDIIAFNGYKRSGKGESANIVEGLTQGLTVKQVGFAAKLKILAARTLGFIDLTDEACIELMDQAKESWLIDIFNESHHPSAPPLVTIGHITGRQYLQNLGTEARKVFGADFWVDQVLPPGRIASGSKWKDTDMLLITDLRFENEAQRVLDLGGEVWRINRPEAESDGHDSEQRLPDGLVTREVDNSGTLADLERKLETALANHWATEAV